MTNSEAVVLFDYLYWLRDRILSAATELSSAEFTSESSVTTRSLRETLVHELEGQWAWRMRLTTGAFPDHGLDPNDDSGVASIAEHWMRDELAMREWLRGLTDDDLANPPPGVEDVFPLWYYMINYVSHAIQQFSEAAVLLTRAGQSPGEIGFLRSVQSAHPAD